MSKSRASWSGSLTAFCLALVMLATACSGGAAVPSTTPAPATSATTPPATTTSPAAPAATTTPPATTPATTQTPRPTASTPAGTTATPSATATTSATPIVRPAPVAGGAAASATPVVLYHEDFETGTADHWQLDKGWDVTRDTDGNLALHGEGHVWASDTGETWSDYTLRLRVKLEQGTLHINYAAHEITRYFIGFMAGGLYLNKTVSFDEQPRLTEASGPFQAGTWYQVEIAVKDGHVTVAVDGVTYIDYTDPAPYTSGGVSLECLDASSVWADDVTVIGPAPAGLTYRWVKTGGPIGGLGYDVRMRPGQPDTMYVTDAWSGVNLSHDGGVTWAADNAGIITRAGASGDAIPVFSLTIDPSNPDIIWVGTQNSRGIYKSTDGGLTWVEKDQGVTEDSGITFRGFTVDPADSNTVYAAAEIASFAWAGDLRPGREFDRVKGAVYKTTDGGAHWTAVWRGDDLARYIWIDPRDRNTLYVSTGIFDREAANSDPVANTAGGVGILKSSDGGQTWQVFGQPAGLQNLYIGTLFMDPADPDVLLAGAGNNAYVNGSGIYRTADGGATWQRVLPTQQAISAVEFSVSDPDIAYAAGPDAFYRSEDAGLTWRKVTATEGYWGPAGVRAGFPIDLQVDPANPDRIFANNYGGGNFLSTDGGRTWSVASTGYTGAQLHDIAVDPTDPNRLFVIGRSGPFRSSDGGASWQGLTTEPAVLAEWYAIAIDPSRPDTIIMSDEHQGVIFRSADGGDHWTLVYRDPGVNGADAMKRMGFKDIAFAPSDPNTLYAGMAMNRNAIDQQLGYPSYGVYKSTDNGRTWRPANDATSATQNINALAVDPADPATVYAATLASGVLKTTDGGQSWHLTNSGLHSLDVRAIAVDPRDPQVVYAGTEASSLYKSVDGGATWAQVSAGLDLQASVRAIAIDPAHPGIVFAADLRTGVYRSADGGATWTRMDEGLRTRAVKSLALSSDGRYLYAATEGEGVFTVDVTPAG